MKKLHYVYRITHCNSGEFYIGVRGTYRQDPLKDLGIQYFTSGQMQDRFISNPNSFKREILFQTTDRKAAEVRESKIIKNHFNHPLCMNKAYVIKLNSLKRIHLSNSSFVVSDPDYQKKVKKIRKLTPKMKRRLRRKAGIISPRKLKYRLQRALKQNETKVTKKRDVTFEGAGFSNIKQWHSEALDSLQKFKSKPVGKSRVVSNFRG